MLISLLNSILITFMLTFSESKESDFFYLINKAEIAICDGQLVDAYKYYNQANEIHQLFTRDLYNNWLLEVKLGKNLEGKKSLNVLLQTVDKNIFLINKRMKFVWEIPYWKNYRDSIQLIILEVDRLALEVEELMISDQAIRQGNLAYQNDSINTLIKKVDSINLMKLITLYGKYSYPHDDSIGSNSPWGDLPGHIILIHNYQWRRDWMDKVLERKISEGKLDPRRFVPVNGRLNKYYASQFLRITGNDTLAFMIKMDDISLKSDIDSARAKFNLETTDENRKKISFNLVNIEYAFYNQNEVPWIPEEIMPELRPYVIELPAANGR